MPKVMKDKIQQETDFMMKWLKDNGFEFEGNDPVEDAMKVYYQKNIKKIDYSSENRQASNQDPFIDYGPGVISYFRMIKMMILLFGIFSVLTLPLMVIYINGGALTERLN